MRELEDANKLSCRSLPEVVDLVGELHNRLRRDKGVRFAFNGKTKAPTKAAIVNAIMVRVLAMDDAERRAFVGEGMRELNRLLAGPEAQAEPTTSVTRPARPPSARPKPKRLA